MAKTRRTVEYVGEAITLVACPQCGSIAELTDRRVLNSTAGAVDHGRVRCVGGHCFLMPLEGLVGDAL